MKHINLVFACVWLLVATGETMAGNWLVGGNLGAARGDTNARQLNSQLTTLGLNATATSDDSREAWQLYLGYQYTPIWGVEIGYVDLGDVNTTISGSVSDVNAFMTSVGAIHPQTAQGWQLSGVFRYFVEQDLKLVFRAGILDWNSEYKLESNSASRSVDGSGTSGTFGVGTEMVLSKTVQANINYERYRIDGESISVVSGGLSYHF